MKPRLVKIHNERFKLVLKRQRGAALYANRDRTKYLRIGEKKLIEKEFEFHCKLLESGFPVAPIFEYGKKGKLIYWIEESLGKEHFGDLFFHETIANGRISEHLFRKFLHIVKQAHNAQEKTLEVGPIDSAALAKAVGFNDILLELPHERTRLIRIWKRILTDMKGYPFCFTHGDFLPNNILERGIIDFGDHFFGPVGYDMIDAITVSWWFPKEDGFEYKRRSTLTDKQINRYFDTVSMYHKKRKKWNILKKFDSLFFLRATWWTVRNHPAPKLQAWRYDRYRLLMRLYLQGKSLFEYWKKHKDD